MYPDYTPIGLIAETGIGTRQEGLPEKTAATYIFLIHTSTLPGQCRQNLIRGGIAGLDQNLVFDVTERAEWGISKYVAEGFAQRLVILAARPVF